MTLIMYAIMTRVNLELDICSDLVLEQFHSGARDNQCIIIINSVYSSGDGVAQQRK